MSLQIIADYNRDSEGNIIKQNVEMVTKVHPLVPIVILEQIPDKFSNISVEYNNVKLIKVDNLDELTSSNKFFVDYGKQRLYVSDTLLGKKLIIKYMGIGSLRVDSSMVVTRQDENGNVVELLSDILEGNSEAFELINDLGTISNILSLLDSKITNGNEIIDTINNFDLQSIKDSISALDTKCDSLQKEITDSRTDIEGITHNSLGGRLDKIDSINSTNTTEIIKARGEETSIGVRITRDESKIELLDNKIGILENIKVNNRDSIVDAINEIFDNIKKEDLFPWFRWVRCADLPRKIQSFGVGIINNYIFVWNGSTDTGHNGKVFKYNINTNVWTDITNNGDFSCLLGHYTTQEGSVSFKYNNENYILSIGGYSDETKKRRTEIIRVTDKGANVIGYMNYNRQGASCVYNDGKIYIIGGYTNDECYCNKVEVFNLSTKQTTILPPIPINVDGYVTSAIKDNKIYIFESSLESNKNNFIYDIETKTYSTFAKSELQKSGLCKAALYDDRYIILIGGYEKMLIWYDTVDNTYTDKSRDNDYVRAWCTPVIDSKDRLYMIGGVEKDNEDNRVVLSDVSCYLPDRDKEETN